MIDEQVADAFRRLVGGDRPDVRKVAGQVERLRSVEHREGTVEVAGRL